MRTYFEAQATLALEHVEKALSAPDLRPAERGMLGGVRFALERLLLRRREHGATTQDRRRRQLPTGDRA